MISHFQNIPPKIISDQKLSYLVTGDLQVSKNIYSPLVAWKTPARVATTENLPSLFGFLVIDGVQTVLNDRILVKNQTNKTQNGIYLAKEFDWERSIDCANNSVSSGIFIYVIEGTLNSQIFFYSQNGIISETELNFYILAQTGTPPTGTTGGLIYNDQNEFAVESNIIFTNDLFTSKLKFFTDFTISSPNDFMIGPNITLDRNVNFNIQTITDGFVTDTTPPITISANEITINTKNKSTIDPLGSVFITSSDGIINLSEPVFDEGIVISTNTTIKNGTISLVKQNVDILSSESATLNACQGTITITFDNPILPGNSISIGFTNANILVGSQLLCQIQKYDGTAAPVVVYASGLFYITNLSATDNILATETMIIGFLCF